MSSPVLGIMGAMDVEVAALRDTITEPRVKTVFGCDVVTGSLDGHPVLLAKSGVGKVNAALTTAAMAQAGAGCLVFVGVAGAIVPNVKMGDAVIATELIQHDVDISTFGHPLGVIDGQPAGGTPDKALADRLVRACRAIGVEPAQGVIASGDQFISSPERAAAIASQFGAIAVEMEGAAVAQVCRRIGLPFAVLRWISDTADGQATADFPVFARQVADLDLEVIRTFLARTRAIQRQAI